MTTPAAQAEGRRACWTATVTPTSPSGRARNLPPLACRRRSLPRTGPTAADVLWQQLPLIEQPPTVVTLTMGGNDLLAIYGNSAAAETAIGEVVAVGEEVLSRLNAASGGAGIVVTTVYDPGDGTGDADATGLWPWPEGPAVVRALNAALTGLAGRHGALVADGLGHDMPEASFCNESGIHAGLELVLPVVSRSHLNARVAVAG